MKMSNLEFVSYEEFPTDQYTKALCSFRIDGKYLAVYGKKLYKDGGMSWKAASHCVNANGAKKYEDGFSMDSKSDEKKILEFIRECEKKHASKFIDELPKEASVHSEELPF
jgi:hypothetical protein